MSEEKKTIELNDEELEKVSGGNVAVYDENGKLLSYYGNYDNYNLIFMGSDGRIFLKNIETNLVMEVIDGDFDAAVRLINE